MNVVDEAFLARVNARLPGLRLSTDADDLVHYGRDWTRFVAPRAGAIAFPRDAAETAALLDEARQAGVGVVPSAGRTGLAGGAVATSGELVVSVERMSDIAAVDVASATVRVGAGAVLERVQEAATAAGLYFPVDLGARGSCRVGGNIATNAGGLRVIRYGAMRAWVLGLKVALPSGEVLTLPALEKNNTGFDLRQLFIGSEGTLGIVTDATLKLTGPPGPTDVALFALSRVDAALALLGVARRRGLKLLSFELFSARCLDEVEARTDARSPFAQRSACYALLECEREHDIAAFVTDDEVAALVEDAVIAGSRADARALWALRERITESLALRGLVHKADVAVAVRDVPAFVDALDELLRRDFPRLELFLFGHVGDGNVHVNLPRPPALDEDVYRADVKGADLAIAALLQRFGGSVSAEHGIGLLKRPLLGFSRSPVEIAAFRAIKRAFDPMGIMNPGKLLPDDDDERA